MPRERTWTDRSNREWYLCDVCDAAVAETDVFVAWVDDTRTKDAGAFYCRVHALEIISDWALKLSDAMVPHNGNIVEDCWCGDPTCGVEA